MRHNNESDKVPCKQCGQYPVDFQDEKFMSAMKLSASHVALAERLDSAWVDDLLEGFEFWLETAILYRDSVTEITPDEFRSLGHVIELQRFLRDLSTERAIEQALLDNDLPERKQTTQRELEKAMEEMITQQSHLITMLKKISKAIA